MVRVYRKGAGLLDQIVARAHREAGLRRDVTALDIAWLIEQFSRRTPDAVDPREESRVRVRLVAIALDGLRTTGARPLPGPPPSRSTRRLTPAGRDAPRGYVA